MSSIADSSSEGRGVTGLTDDVDPDIRKFLKLTFSDSRRFGSAPGLTPSMRRAVAEKVRERWTAGGPEMHSTSELRVGALDTRIRIHYPVADAAPLPTLVYLHGGGWTIFSLDTHDRLMREYAARARCGVVGIDYSLSPEAKFPRALDEIVEVIGWLRAEGAKHGIDPQRIAIGGDSAGANLALTTNLALRQRGEPTAQAMLLNYGAYDMAERPSYARYDSDDYMLTVPEMNEFWANYLNSADDEANPLARPLQADLQGMPPAFLCIAECDILADENREMALRLRNAGADVTEIVYSGATHSFLEAVSISQLADVALDDASAWLRRTIGGHAA